MAIIRGVTALKGILLVALAYGSVLAAQKHKSPNTEIQTGGWWTYSGDYTGQRHSALAQITSANVTRLAPAWTFTTGEKGPLEATPLVVDGTLYFSGLSNTAWAIDG